MMLAHRSDKKKTPDLAEYRPATLEEITATWPARVPTFYWLDDSGRAANVRESGAPQYRGRGADRAFAYRPFKFGMYESFHVTAADLAAGKLLVAVS